MSMASGRPALPFVTGAARLHPGDLAGLASIGLRSRKLRAALSALGIAIGVAAIVAVPGLSQSSAAALNAEIARLGTNLLTVANGQSLTGGTAELPLAAPGMVGQLPGVTAVQYTGQVSNANAYRTPYIPAIFTNALSVDAASLDLPAVVGTSVTQGSYLNAATAREPVAVLGAAAAQRLGFDRVWPGMRIQVGGLWFYAVGILSPAVLAPEIDSSILIGFPAAEKYLHFDGHPSQIYVRTTPDNQAVTITVDGLLGAQANPENPSEVDVSQPSDALTAQADAAGAFDTLFLGLGAVALLVGAVGVANIMIISVLERRQEIGLRRALGATRGQIRAQFLAEAILLALAGGATGDITGVAATAVYAHARGWAIVIPPRPGPAAWPPPCSSAPLPDSCPPSAPPGCHPPRRSGASDTKAAGLLPCPLARYQSPARPANRSGRGRKPGLLNTTQQVGPALGTALVGLLFFSLLASGSGRGVNAVTPSVRSQLTAAGVPAADQGPILAGFRACVHDQSAATDPTQVPASCRPRPVPGASPAQRVQVQTTLARGGLEASAYNFSRSFSATLWYAAGMLIVIFLSIFGLPRQVRIRGLEGELTETPEAEYSRGP